MSDTSEHLPEPKKARRFGLVQKNKFCFLNLLQRKTAIRLKKRKPLNKDGTASEDNTLPEMVKDCANKPKYVDYDSE